MEDTRIKDQIVSLLEGIVERSNFIGKRHPGKDMSLDIDLVCEDIRALYRQYELLRQCQHETAQHSVFPGDKPEAQPLPPPAATDQPPREDVSVPPPPPVREASKEKAPAPPPPPVREASKEEAPAPPPPPVREASKEEVPAPPPPPVREASKEETPVSPAAHKPLREETPASEPTQPKGRKAVIDLLGPQKGKTIGDSYAQEDNSINQRISGQKTDHSIGARMQQHPIANLKEAIGLNEKFLFINELFEGNIQVYNDSLNRLNEAGDMNAALDILNEAGKAFSWDSGTSSDTLDKFVGYVQRRYMK